MGGEVEELIGETAECRGRRERPQCCLRGRRVLLDLERRQNSDEKATVYSEGS